MRTLAAGVLALALAAALLEGGALLLRALRPETWRSRAEIDRALRSLAPSEVRVRRGAYRYEWWLRDTMLHPYLGFARSPEAGAEVRARLFPDVAVNDHGFFGPDPVQRRGPERWVLALLGGSVALELYLHSEAALREALGASPALRGREVVVVCLALEGMKQPQQLLALAWLLSLGGEVDAVVNLDGFNEVVLPFVDNLPFGVSPAYPRSWHLLASKGLDLTAAAQVGRIAEVEERRRARARRLLGSPLGHSFFALSLWDRLDARARGRVRSLQERMRAHLEERQGSLSAQERGPGAAFESRAEARRHLVELWSRSSLQLARLAAANGAAYLHFLQPNQYLEGSKRFGEAERQVAFSAPGAHPMSETTARYRTHAGQGYPLLVAAGPALRARGVRFVDLTGLFADEPEPIYADDCCHYNPRGYDRVAREIARHLADALAP